ncbi:BA14K family protein [Bradyrhizobium sp. dw_78]|uniref:BA14K family protein n=1 Tax=Bradyrhizobium sp. dw_78 TaxID=2719793 RepID=UPI001BD4C737|nr:BA14K family protein [Bradyrhizobium sp. dw_78]
MMSLRVLSTVAAIALALPMLTPTASFAQHHGGGHGGGGHMGGVHMGGGHMGGGMRRGGGGHFAGGGYRGGFHRGGGGAFIPGAIAGAVIGGALASDAYGYDGPGYYGYGPGYDDSYVDDSDDSVVPIVPGGDASAYCAQRYRSYDPASGTYLGYDGARHPCP